MKRFLTSLLVLSFMFSLAIPANAALEPDNQWLPLEEELKFLPDPNQEVALPTLPNSKTIQFLEDAQDSFLPGIGQVMPITFSECTYESFTAPGALGSIATLYTDVTIKTGGSVRADFSRCCIVLHDFTAQAWDGFTSSVGLMNVEDDPQYSEPKDVKKFGITVSNNNFIGYKSCYPHLVYGRGLTWTFNKPGTYYIDILDPMSENMRVKLKVVDTVMTANPTTNQVLVNGKPVSFDAYNFNNNNYFKLRDIALALQGTSKQFEVVWNAEKNAIELLSNKPYTVVGSELTQGDGTAKQAKDCISTIYKDGVVANLKAYTINGNNYFKLRDLGEAFDFNVSWDSKNNAIVINTFENYSAE